MGVQDRLKAIEFQVRPENDPSQALLTRFLLEMNGELSKAENSLNGELQVILRSSVRKPNGEGRIHNTVVSCLISCRPAISCKTKSR